MENNCQKHPSEYYLRLEELAAICSLMSAIDTYQKHYKASGVKTLQLYFLYKWITIFDNF